MGDAAQVTSTIPQGYSSAQAVAAAQVPVMSTKKRWYNPVLMEGEAVETAFDLGFWTFDLYTIFATNKRLIIVKRFPKNLMEVDYSQIELMEYYTDVEWLKGLYALLGILFSFIFLASHDKVLNSVY